MICEVCGNNTEEVLKLGSHPLCDDLVEIGSPRQCTLYPVNIFYCTSCRTALNECRVDKNTLFPEEYHYRSRFTSDVLLGMEDLLDEANYLFGLHSKKILDIGCNDGSLLDIAHQKYNCITFGIEPTGAAVDAQAKGHQVDKNYFDKDVARKFVTDNGYPEVITFTNVFAHISDLNSLLEGVKELLSPSAVLVIENHYLGGVIKRGQFDTFYHEHPRTYSLKSFFVVADSLGLKVSKATFPNRYGGNIRVFMSQHVDSSRDDELQQLLIDDEICNQIKLMQVKVSRWVSRKSSILNALITEYGPLPAKAFPGRSAILYKMLQASTDIISACFEKNSSLKVGHYVPGTNIPIHAEDDIAKYLKNDEIPIVNSAWHISYEIRTYVRNTLGLKNPIIDLVEQQDFE